MNRRLIAIAALCVAFLETRGKDFNEILRAIAHERYLQNKQWGGADHDKNHTDVEWLFLIMKHVGRLAQVMRQPNDRDLRDVRDSIAIVGRSTEEFI